MRFTSLSQWLQWQETLHFTEIDPGLERVAAVWHKMGGQTTLPFKLVTVAGTNGKGSSVAITASILRAAGYKTATYTSPHLLRYNERISINDTPCSDDTICQSFARIDEARGDISLTYFEFATLAAADIFSREQVDIAVLEVGMGGRLDAVNLFDTDIALITPIGLDHTAWLGTDREQIGREKAGIVRAERALVCSEASPPNSVLDYAKSLQAPTYIANAHFQHKKEVGTWHWQNSEVSFNDLPLPTLLGDYQIQNSAAVLQVCYLLNQLGLTITEHAIRLGLQQVKLAGRFQVVEGPVTRILDVTHNQQGANNLSTLLKHSNVSGKTYAVLAMLRDKDSAAVATVLDELIDHWYVAGLEGSRGLPASSLAESLRLMVSAEKISEHDKVVDAYTAAMAAANTGDRVLIFGSFHTVEAVMQLMPESQ